MGGELHFTRGRNDAGENVNVGGLVFTDPTGGQALLHVHNAIEAGGGRVVFEHPRQEVLRVLRLMGLDQVLDIRP